MDNMIFIAYFTLTVIGLTLAAYYTGKDDAYEEMEEVDNEIIEKIEQEADLTTRVRRLTRKHKRIDFDLCAEQSNRRYFK